MNKKITIIAEMAWAHDGKLGKAIDIMKAAKDAGADAIGIHVTQLEDYMVTAYGSGEGRVSAGKEHLDLFNYLDEINLSHEDWKNFSNEAKKIGIGLCVMPNDKASLDFTCDELDPTYLVLTAASFVEKDFIIELAKKDCSTLFRIGGATLGEIEETINLFQKNTDAEVILLHGFQNYPTALDEINISQLKALKNLFNLQVGLADHIDGGDPLALTIPVIALAAGATFIEKHITFDRSEKGEDFEAAINPEDFKVLVNNICAAEIALGESAWKPLSEAALRYRAISRKRIVANKDMSKGTILTPENIIFKRSDQGVNGEQFDSIINRKLKVDIKENEGISLEHLE